MKKRIFLYGGLALLVAVFFIAYFSVWQPWLAKRMVDIEYGMADSEFPWGLYSQAELDDRNPEKILANTKTTVTPEQTYAKFREALRSNDLDLAIEQLAKMTPKYKDNAQTLKKAHEEGKFKEAYQWYPEEIEQEYIYDAIAQYSFNAPINGEVSNHAIEFQKNFEGVWLIESI